MTAVQCFTVAQIVQIVAMTGHAMMTGILLLGVMKWQGDDGMHHIITAISDKPAQHWDRSTVSITSYLPA